MIVRHGSPQTSAPIVRAYLVLSGLFTLAASLIWGVNTLFLLAAGLDIFQVFIANAAFTAGMVLFEIPTGVVADTAGRRLSFLISAITLLVGTLGYLAVYAVGGGVIPFVLVSVVLGLGFSFYSGAVEAWLVDALKATGYQGHLDGVFARGAIVSGVAMLLGAVGGGLLGALDLSVPFVARSVLLATAFVVGLWLMHDIGFTPRAMSVAAMPTEMRKVADASVQFGWRSRPVRLLMVVALLYGGFLMWAFYAWPPYFMELLGSDAVWVTGLVYAFMALAAIAGNALVEFFTRFCGRRTTLLAWAAAVMATAAAGVGLVGSFWPAVLLLLVLNVAEGVSTPVQQAYLHDSVPSAQRATVVSAVSLVGSAGGIGGQLGLGFVSRTQSVAAGYLVGGVATLLVVPPVLALRRLRGRADVIVGRKAGKAAPCAAQGVPQVAMIDATARQPTSS